MKVLAIALQCLLLSPTTGVAAAAASPAAVNARATTSQVERSFVGTGSASGYTDQLVRFMLHLFDNRKEYLVDVHRNQMEMYNDTDSRNFQQKPKRCGNNRPQLRSYIRRSISKIEPARDGSPHNSPFKIDGDGALNYSVIRDYMYTKFNVVEVDHDSAVTYLRAIDKGEDVSRMQTTADGKVRLQIYQSGSQFSAIRSAIGYVYKSARVSQPEEMTKELGLFIKGMSRVIAAAKNHLGLKIIEGKDAMTFEAYELLAKTLFYSK